MKDYQISKHLWYSEVVRSAKADELNIENRPNLPQLANIKLLANKVIEPSIARLGEHFYFDSVFRNSVVNAAVGGAPNSQHQANIGAACDINNSDYPNWPDNRKIFDDLKKHIYDQLIWEFGDDNEPAWVHVSYQLGYNRFELLRSRMINGEKVYEDIKRTI